jgi:5'-3' exonuclease
VDDESKNLSDDEAKLWYWAQVLAGDPGDNVSGCWGLGLAKASKFLVQCNGLNDDEMWPKIVRKYKDSQKLEDCPYKDKDAASVALETARLIRLRQEMNEPLWTPKLRKEKDAVPPRREDATKEESSSCAGGAGVREYPTTGGQG